MYKKIYNTLSGMYIKFTRASIAGLLHLLSHEDCGNPAKGGQGILYMFTYLFRCIKQPASFGKERPYFVWTLFPKRCAFWLHQKKIVLWNKCLLYPLPSLYRPFRQLLSLMQRPWILHKEEALIQRYQPSIFLPTQSGLLHFTSIAESFSDSSPYILYVSHHVQWN